jgi:hypothetical protein
MTSVLRVLAAVLGFSALVLGVVAGVLAQSVPTEDVLEGMIWGSATLSLALIGAVIAVRRPNHAVGWLLLIGGFGETLAGASLLYGEYSLATARGLPFADVVWWVGGSMWTFSAAALLVFLPLYFPTGAPPSRRWRWVGWAGVLGVALLQLSTVEVAVFRPELMRLIDWDVVEAAAGDQPLFAVSELGFPVLMVAGPVALVSLIVRFIGSRGEERQQIKLLVFAATMMITFIIGTNLTELPRWAEALGTAIAMPAVGIATMVAVLRYRLFDIDRLISRTLAYAALTVLLVTIYLSAVTILTAVTAPVTGDSPLAVAASTLLAAAAFQPARRRIQSAVDRRFNRARYDAQLTLEAFSSSLRQEVDLDDVHQHLRQTVGSVLEPSEIKVWLRPSGGAATEFGTGAA